MFKNQKFVVVILLLIFQVSPSLASSTANNVKCRGCVDTKDLSNKAVSGTKIKNGAVNFDKLGPDVQTILDTVNTNESRISTLESPTFSGYGLPFSALGDPINAIVLKRVNSDGSAVYNVRTRYHNDTDQISVQGGLITPPLIAVYGNVSVDSGGSITSISQYIEAPQTTSYLDYTAEDKDLDPADPSMTLSLNSDNIREVWTCSGGGAVSTCDVDVKVDGVSDSTYTPVNVYTALGPGTINGMSFTDLRGAHRTYTSDHSYRVRAKGVGTVLNLSSGRPSTAIYYRVNGVTDGSLTGTPFDTGELLDGLWF